MNRQVILSNIFNKWLNFLGTILIVILTVIPSTFSQTVYSNPSAVDLLSAGNFRILAASACTIVPPAIVTGNVGATTVTNSSTINGNLGGTTLTNSGHVTGNLWGTTVTNSGTCDGTTTTGTNTEVPQAQSDYAIVYSNIVGRTADSSLATGTDLGGTTLGRGIYASAGSFIINGTLTLTGTSTDIFIFQMISTLTTASGSEIKLTGGVQASNVYWQVGSTASIGGIFRGNVLAYATITENAGASIEGNLYTRTSYININGASVLLPVELTFTDGAAYVPGNITSGQNTQPFGRFTLQASATGGSITAADIKLSGTRSAGEVSNIILWYSIDAAFGSDTQLGATVGTDPGTDGTASFTGFSQSIGTSAGYYFISCDVGGGATGVIQGFVVNNAALTLDAGALNSTINNASLSGGDGALPVELKSFTAALNNNTVELNWNTATEVNNYGFDIERSQKSVISSQNFDWKKIGFVKGAGNSNSPMNYMFTDNNPVGSTSFSYRLKQIDINGNYKYYDAVTVSIISSTKAELMQNSPNPFNPSTAIKFYIPTSTFVTITIYNILGKKVTTLINNQTTAAGYHIVFWNGGDSYGRVAASGVYLYMLTAGNFSETKKMTLLK